MMLLKLLKMAGPLEVQYKLTFHYDSSSKLIYSSIVSGFKLANYSSHNSTAEIVIDAKCPKLPPRPYFHYIRENVSHRSYEATGCIRFAVLEAHWVKVNSIVLAFRYLSSLRSKNKK